MVGLWPKYGYWFLAAGVEIEALGGGIVVDEYGLAVQFALDGYVAALARDPLLDRDLASGALVRLVNVTPRFAYYLARDIARVPHRYADILMRWLMDSATSPSARRPMETSSRPSG